MGTERGEDGSGRDMQLGRGHGHSAVGGEFDQGGRGTGGMRGRAESASDVVMTGVGGRVAGRGERPAPGTDSLRDMPTRRHPAEQGDEEQQPGRRPEGPA